MLNLPVPEAEFINEVLKPSEEQQEMVGHFGTRKRMAGLVNPTEDNIGNHEWWRKCALTQRLLNELPGCRKSKVNTCVENAFQVWDEGKTVPTTADLLWPGPPKGMAVSMYDDVRGKSWLPEVYRKRSCLSMNIIRKQKADLCEGKSLAGENPDGFHTETWCRYQRARYRLIAWHHLDCRPWKLSWSGTAAGGTYFKTGNQNDKIKIFRYVMENTLMYMWQILENKQKFIRVRSWPVTLVRAWRCGWYALLCGRSRICHRKSIYQGKDGLGMQVSKLKLLKANYTSQTDTVWNPILQKNFPVQTSALKERIAGTQADWWRT